ncbi:hypothetical protein [Kitasatospora sp. MBT66]|uniref:hypothetical protein n=1 Tax=Kitasatospora sp. MBT66 TaxID=1444769 RepID=UPI0005B80180|nr:hypothetical protein [Kitasatospora sp. MBT66]
MSVMIHGVTACEADNCTNRVTTGITVRSRSGVAFTDEVCAECTPYILAFYMGHSYEEIIKVSVL